MKSHSAADSPQRARTVERLAQKLYERANTQPDARSWVWLGWDMREAWLARARASLDTGGASFDWLFFRKLFQVVRNF